MKVNYFPLRMIAVIGLMFYVICNSYAFAQYTGTGQKVVVIDSGLMSDDAVRLSKTSMQYCSSRQNDITSDSTNATDGFVHYNIASTCRFGAASSSHSSASVVPRETEHNFSAIYNYHRFGSPHGSYVTKQVTDTASGASIFAINTSYYSSAKNLDANTTCGHHSASDIKIDLPSNYSNCYPHKNPFSDPLLVNQILSSNNVAAVNISSGEELSCSTSSNQINTIVSSGIPIIAGSGNNGNGSRVLWPACHSSVISVGAATLGGGGSVRSFTSDRGIIDFVAVGETLNYDSTFSVGTSFAAPVVAAAFSMMREAKPSASISEMRYALTQAAIDAGKLVFHNGRNIPYVDGLVARSAAQCLNSGQCLNDNGSGAFDAIAYNDGGQYGSIYGDIGSNYTFDIDFNNLGISIPNAKILGSDGSRNTTPSLIIEAPNERDVILSLDGKMASNSSNGLRVYINNIQRAYTGLFINEESFEFTFKRSFFSSGNNTIRIEPNFSSRQWGISNVTAEFTPVVALTLNQVDGNEYGSGENPVRPTGLRTSFKLSNVDEDVKFAVRGWSISDATEIAVYLNGLEQGFLTPSSSIFTYNNGDLFTLEKADLIEGVNLIEFVQKESSGNSSATSDWGVSNLLVAQENASSSTLILGTADTIQYGRNYGTNENTFQLDASFTPMSQHDHKISWSVYDVDQTGDVEVWLNNWKIKDAGITSNNSLGGIDTITIAWRLFQPGTNILSFKAKVNASDDTWGVTNIKVRTSDVIDLDSPASLDQDYGYFEKYTGGIPSGWTRNYSYQDYQTRLYATFDHAGSEDKFVNLTGWDIDSATELSVHLNGTFLQYVSSAEESSIYSVLDRITIPNENLLQGINMLSVRSEDSYIGFQNEKWGIKFDAIGDAKVNLVPVIMLLLDE